MINYWINKWQIKRKFEETENGWVYRQLDWSAPIPVSDAEREELISKYARSGLWDILIMFVVILLGACAIVFLQFAMPNLFSGGSAKQAARGLAFLALAVFGYRSYRAWSYPVRRFNERQSVGPSLSYWDWISRDLGQRPWWKVILPLLVSALLFGALVFLLTKGAKLNLTIVGLTVVSGLTTAFNTALAWTKFTRTPSNEG